MSNSLHCTAALVVMSSAKKKQGVHTHIPQAHTNTHTHTHAGMRTCTHAHTHTHGFCGSCSMCTFQTIMCIYMHTHTNK